MGKDKKREMGSMFLEQLKERDPEIFSGIQKEKHRQQYGLEMIASENYTSRAVMEAQGSVLTNKYAEGYPKKRYYGGCQFVDELEIKAIERAQKLFNCSHANVQPHSGSQANMAVFMATLNKGDTILGMDLSQGGHLTHGSPVNFSGMLYKSITYGLNEDHRIDYDQIYKLSKEHKPQLIIAGYSAYPRTLDFSRFKEIAQEVGAYLMVDMAHFAGLVAAGNHPSPVSYADFITSTTHKTLRGPRGGLILCSEEKARLVNSRVFPGIQGGPLEHVIAAKAVAFKEALAPEFKHYIQKVVDNAKTLAHHLLRGGFELVSGGTDNHLILIDLSSKKLTGQWAEKQLDEAGITVNKNTVPGEKESPFVTSGIRIGTPALTTRGMGESEMKLIGNWICEILNNPQDEKRPKKIQKKVQELCESFPIYGK